MDFIVDNYVWFIGGGIVLLMIIIGYIAEKTDFGRKPFSTKKANKEVKNEVKEETVEEVAETENTESPVEGLTDFVVEDGFADVEIPEDVVEEDNVVEPAEGTVEETEIPAIEEQIADVDIPEIAAEEADVPEIGDVVEEAVADDSEDDVWKF